MNIILHLLEKDLIEEKECPICYCPITKNNHKLECNHCFHKECIIDYYKNKNYNTHNNIDMEEETIIMDCPYCRKVILEI